MNAKNHLFAYLLLTPALVVLAVFTIFPAGHSLYLSFHEVIPFSAGMDFVGLSHYRELAESAEYRESLHASFLFALYTVPTSIVISLAIALALDQQPFVRGFFRTIFLLPVGISPAMAAMLWVFLFNPTAGYLNYLLDLVGVTGPAWLTDPRVALISVSLTTVWKEVGFNIIFFLAALAAVPPELKEAALLDGAGRWHRFRHVILPMISPTLFFVSVVSLIHAFESFGQIHILTRGGPVGATNVLVYSLYQDAFENFRTGYASSQAVVLFIIIMIATAVQFYFAKRRVHYQ